MALPTAAGHLSQVTTRQVSVATVTLTKRYLIGHHRMPSNTTLPRTQYHGKKMRRTGANGCETKAGRDAHSTARSHNHLLISSSVHVAKFIFSFLYFSLVKYQKKPQTDKGAGGDYA
jgi:hypothetical protein